MIASKKKIIIMEKYHAQGGAEYVNARSSGGPSPTRLKCIGVSDQWYRVHGDCTDGSSADTTLTLDSNSAGVVKKLGLSTKALPMTHDEIITIAMLDTMTRL